ncbi:uncharacterized protein LOC132698165 isoform X2 [Cylas formicarius]|uniref:uncharacterized protein LOC132698165 isoform X2 n=1 Tax=Cylas formicarius TaxID=197179 RepID=UPI002958B3EF|nr:uncharacterized protein LOC132698165 isoform X2 [Cylas formicarius]
MGQLFRFVIVVVVGSVWCSEEIQSNFYREEPCAAQQGYCVLENECPTSPTDQLRSLCPGQKNAGAVCCKNFAQRLPRHVPTEFEPGQKGMPYRNELLRVGII